MCVLHLSFYLLRQKLFGSSSLMLIPHTLSISIFCLLHLCILIQNLPTVCSDSSLAKSRSCIPSVFAVSLLSLLQTAFPASSRVPRRVPARVALVADQPGDSSSCHSWRAHSRTVLSPARVLPSDVWGLPACSLPQDESYLRTGVSLLFALVPVPRTRGANSKYGLASFMSICSAPIVFKELGSGAHSVCTRVQSQGPEDPLEEEMATHSSTLAWEIPWTGAWQFAVHGVAESNRMSTH